MKITTRITKDVTVTKDNAKDVLNWISKKNPYYKFVKALSEGHEVLFNGKTFNGKLNECDFIYPPSYYDIKWNYRWIPWTEKTYPKENFWIRDKKTRKFRFLDYYFSPILNYSILFTDFEWSTSLEENECEWKVCGDKE